MRRRPSISDIAEETGVSIATVSLALRDKGRMSDETRARVKETAERVGYVPNASARSLVGGKTHLITISVPAIGTVPEAVSSVEYFFKLLGAAAARAIELDYGLRMPSPTDRPDRVGVDGAIVVDPAADDPTIAAFDRRGWPVVTIGRRVGDSAPEGGRSWEVDNDFVFATRNVLDHLHERGSKAITLIANEPIDSFQSDSIETYREWCSGHGMEPRVIMSKSPLPDDAAVAAAAALAGDSRPDAVYATVDTLAKAVIDQAGRQGIELPGQLRIATCSDSHIASSTEPQLTTIDEKPVELGEAAVEMLISAITDPESEPHQVQLGTELIIRGSTA